MEMRHMDPAAHLGRVTLGVVDLQPALEFYAHVLGLTGHRIEAQAAELGPAHGEPVLRLESGGRSRDRRPAFIIWHFLFLACDAGRGCLAASGCRFKAHPTTA
jgi:catechol-2,3-dioxygenase